MTSHRVSDAPDTECVGPTVAELATQWIAGRLARGEIEGESPRVERTRIRSLLRLYGDQAVDVLDRRALLEWQATIGRQSPNTRKAYVGCVRRFCEWLVLEERLTADPSIALSRVRVPRGKPRNLRSDQVAQLIATADEVASRRPQGGAQQTVWMAIPALMVGCGLRCIEISRLDLGDYDRQKNLLFVRGKGGHERNVPVPAETVAALDRYLEVRGPKPGPLFLAVGSRPSADRRLAARWIGRKTARIMRAAGVHEPGDRRSAHALRHTFATDVLAESNDLLALQELMGHANLSTTQIYLGLAGEERLRRAVEGRAYRRHVPALQALEVR